MISANPYLFMDDCSRAMKEYQRILGGELKAVQLADGIEGFQGQEGKVLHAELHVGDSVLHFSDLFGQKQIGNQVLIALELESEEEIRRVYEGLLEGGKASLELQTTFWGALHANVTDRNGIGWLLNYQKHPRPAQ